jgi:hypothetical protein
MTGTSFRLDAALVEAVRSGNVDGFNVVYHRWFERVLHGPDQAPEGGPAGGHWAVDLAAGQEGAELAARPGTAQDGLATGSLVAAGASSDPIPSSSGDRSARRLGRSKPKLSSAMAAPAEGPGPTARPKPTAVAPTTSLALTPTVEAPSGPATTPRATAAPSSTVQVTTTTAGPTTTVQVTTTAAAPTSTARISTTTAAPSSTARASTTVADLPTTAAAFRSGSLPSSP